MFILVSFKDDHPLHAVRELFSVIRRSSSMCIVMLFPVSFEDNGWSLADVAVGVVILLIIKAVRKSSSSLLIAMSFKNIIRGQE